MGNFDHYAYGNNVRGAGEACRRQGIAFLPMVVKSFDIWWLARDVWAKHLTSALHTNSSWSKESAMCAYITIKLGKQLARIYCIC